MPAIRPSIQQMVYQAITDGCADGDAIKVWVFKTFGARLSGYQITAAKARLPTAKQLDRLVTKLGADEAGPQR